MGLAIGIAGSAVLAAGPASAAGAPSANTAGSLERTPDGWYREPATGRAQPTLPLHVRGSFNDWKPGLKMKTQDGEIWQAVVALEAGRHEFKIGDFRWRVLDFGAREPGLLRTGTWTTMRERGGNLAVEVPASGRYTVSFRWLVRGPDVKSRAAQVKFDGPV